MANGNVYTTALMEHNAHPDYKYELADFTHEHEGVNPSCGDEMVLRLRLSSDGSTIEEAALIMYDKKIGGLPVVSQVGAVVGVITETDIFKTFVDVMELTGGKTRLTVLADNKVGVVNELSGVFAADGLSIDSLVTCKQPDGSYEIVIRGDIPDVASLKEKIEAKGYKVIHSVRFS